MHISQRAQSCFSLCTVRAFQSSQYVLPNSPIRFRHYTYIGDYHEIVLYKRQVLNLHDVINSLRTFNPLNYYPLVGGIWLFCEGPNIKLNDNHSHAFFRFYRNSWYAYVKAYSRLRRFLCVEDPLNINLMRTRSTDSRIDLETLHVSHTKCTNSIGVDRRCL